MACAQQQRPELLEELRMPTIRLGVFSIAEAEKLLAKIWLRVERNGEETPRIRIEFKRDGRVGVWVACPDPMLAAGFISPSLPSRNSSVPRREALADHPPALNRAAEHGRRPRGVRRAG